MTSKLHEVLSVESSLEKSSRQRSDESIRTFSKDNLFKGSTKRLSMFNEEDKHLETVDHQELVTTVDENLEYLMGSIDKYWSTVLVKERTNQHTTADIVLEDGTILAENLPATFLLGLETKLGNLRKVYEAIPTLAPGIKWIEDKMDKAGIFKNANDTVVFKSKKDVEFRIAYEATEHHPAQVESLENTVNVGKYSTTSTCGMLAPVDKASRLSKLDEVLHAIKKARMRANNIDIVSHDTTCKKILKFINS